VINDRSFISYSLLSVHLSTVQLQSKFIYQNAWFSVFASSQST